MRIEISFISLFKKNRDELKQKQNSCITMGGSKNFHVRAEMGWFYFPRCGLFCHLRIIFFLHHALTAGFFFPCSLIIINWGTKRKNLSMIYLVIYQTLENKFHKIWPIEKSTWKLFCICFIFHNFANAI